MLSLRFLACVACFPGIATAAIYEYSFTAELLSETILIDGQDGWVEHEPADLGVEGMLSRFAGAGPVSGRFKFDTDADPNNLNQIYWTLDDSGVQCSIMDIICGGGIEDVFNSYDPATGAISVNLSPTDSNDDQRFHIGLSDSGQGSIDFWTNDVFFETSSGGEVFGDYLAYFSVLDWRRLQGPLSGCQPSGGVPSTCDQIAPVPVPSALPLTLSGLLVFQLVRSRRSARARTMVRQ